MDKHIYMDMQRPNAKHLPKGYISRPRTCWRMQWLRSCRLRQKSEALTLNIEAYCDAYMYIYNTSIYIETHSYIYICIHIYIYIYSINFGFLLHQSLLYHF